MILSDGPQARQVAVAGGASVGEAGSTVGGRWEDLGVLPTRTKGPLVNEGSLGSFLSHQQASLYI